MKAQSAKALQQKISITLKVIQSLAYTTDDTDRLRDLLLQLEALEKQFRRILPSTEGLIMCSTSLSDRTKRIKRKYSKLLQQAQHYSTLDLYRKHKPGRKRQDWRFRNRVGAKADRLQEVSKLYLFIYLLASFLPLYMVVHSFLQNSNSRPHHINCNVEDSKSTVNHTVIASTNSLYHRISHNYLKCILLTYIANFITTGAEGR